MNHTSTAPDPSVTELAGAHAVRTVPSTAPADPSRHASWTIALHWASALAVVACAAAGLGRDLTENEPLRLLLLDIHRQTGLFVLLALGARLMVRWRRGLADHAGGMSPTLRRAALAAHLALYALLLALPLLGIATSQAHEVHLRLFGLLPLPMVVPADADLADTLSDWHVWAAWALLALVVLHVAAALWHHSVRRDGVLRAMLPAWPGRGQVRAQQRRQTHR